MTFALRSSIALAVSLSVSLPCICFFLSLPMIMSFINVSFLCPWVSISLLIGCLVPQTCSTAWTSLSLRGFWVTDFINFVCLSNSRLAASPIFSINTLSATLGSLRYGLIWNLTASFRRPVSTERRNFRWMSSGLNCSPSCSSPDVHSSFSFSSMARNRKLWAESLGSWEMFMSLCSRSDEESIL